jgi:threonine/homoserine/homoserine lactone efflux protein
LIPASLFHPPIASANPKGRSIALLGLITDNCYALVAGAAGQWLKHSRGYLAFERYIAGTLFIGLGLTAAFAGNHEK